jgi:hypothetical protein
MNVKAQLDQPVNHALNLRFAGAFLHHYQHSTIPLRGEKR